MYLIANVSKKHVIIDDLGITISPRQALDLHKFKCLISPEKSTDLELCKKTGQIKVLKKSKKRNKTVVVQDQSLFDQDKLLDAIQKLMKTEIQKQITENRDSNQDKLLSTLVDMKELIKNQKQTVIVQNDQQIKQDDPDTSILDDETMAEIHARTVDKIAEDTEAKVEYEDQEIVDSSFGNNLEELEELL